MHPLATDQAEGLRRLLGRQTPRVVTLVSGAGRTGKTCAATNLAVAIARAGRSVLLLDENSGPNNVPGLLGVSTRTDLLDAVRGERALEQTLVAGPEGLLILPAGRGVRALGDLDERGRARLIEGFARIGAALDLILVDTAAGTASRLLPLSHPDQEVILVATATGAGQADAYGMIKLMHRELGRRRLHLLVSMARSQDEARSACCNLSRVAQRYLDAGVDYFGAVPKDERINQAAQTGRTAIELFPHAPCSVEWRRQAQRILQWPGKAEETGGMERFVQRLILGSRLRIGIAEKSAA